ncbi:MAG: hypothetical protein H0T79_05145, partial [Deltaproteobacteria bacterium]|nr:hypothetical protein [Deltaproteobacteria bacterium]
MIAVAVALRADAEHAAERLDQIGAEIRLLVTPDHELEQVAVADIGPQIVVEPELVERGPRVAILDQLEEPLRLGRHRHAVDLPEVVGVTG